MIYKKKCIDCGKIRPIYHNACRCYDCAMARRREYDRKNKKIKKDFFKKSS
jgi:hypothetical protein